MKKLLVFSKCKRLFFIALLLLSPVVTKAGSFEDFVLSLNYLSVFLILVLSFVVLVLFYLIRSLNQFLNIASPAKESLFAGLMKQFNDSVPVEQEGDILTDHNYDGIQELDNNLPPWWKYLFYATIVFSGIYIYYYHFSDGGMSQIEEYEVEMAMAAKQKEAFRQLASNSIDESNVEMAGEEGIAKGATLFTSYCAACHGKAGEGGVGPNLADEFWLHGGGIKNVFKTIKYGVPEKGMIAWQSQLSPENIRDISSFIISIQGTNPPNAKKPQGEKYEEPQGEVAQQ